MADLATTTITMVVAGLWGAIGGFVYWATPKIPAGVKQFFQRVGTGWVVGALSNALGGVSPFTAAGEWDPSSVGKLILAGFVGLSAVASFLPKQLNENLRPMFEASTHAEGSADSR